MNEHSQRAVGAVVENKPPGLAPDLRPLFGRWMQARAGLGRKARPRSLRVLQGQRPRRPHLDLYGLWAVCRSREFPGLAQGARSGRDPWFYAFVRRDTGKAAGMGAFMRLDAANGVIEIGHIWMSPQLQRTREATEAIFLMMRHASTNWASGGSNGNAMRSTRPRARRPSASASPSRAFSASISSSRAATATPPGFRSSTRNGRRSGKVPGLAQGREFRRRRAAEEK